jgi:hypothetical protein
MTDLICAQESGGNKYSCQPIITNDRRCKLAANYFCKSLASTQTECIDAYSH